MSITIRDDGGLDKNTLSFLDRDGDTTSVTKHFFHLAHQDPFGLGLGEKPSNDVPPKMIPNWRHFG